MQQHEQVTQKQANTFEIISRCAAQKSVASLRHDCIGIWPAYAPTRWRTDATFAWRTTRSQMEVTDLYCLDHSTTWSRGLNSSQTWRFCRCVRVRLCTICCNRRKKFCLYLPARFACLDVNLLINGRRSNLQWFPHLIQAIEEKNKDKPPWHFVAKVKHCLRL